MALSSESGGQRDGVEEVLISVANSSCELFKIERSVATVSMADCDLTDSTFYRCIMTAQFSNCILKNAEFVDVRLSSDSALTFFLSFDGCIQGAVESIFRGLYSPSWIL